MMGIMNKRILIVEQDKEIAEKLNSMLYEEGYATRRADNEQGIYAAIEEFNPNLILMDYFSSSSIGFNRPEICKRLAANSNTNLPVIILSERTKLRIKQALKYSLFPEKPFSLHYIIRQINSCMQALG
jgi:DNA-binding response OmpR family regulator